MLILNGTAQWLNTRHIIRRSRGQILTLTPGERTWQNRLDYESVSMTLLQNKLKLVGWLCPGSIVVGHSTHNHKIEGYNPATDTGREKMAKQT